MIIIKMTNEYVRLEGKDLGIIAGGTLDVAPQGIFIYKPKNDLVPNTEMSREEFIACVTNDNDLKYANIDYQAVRQLEVNGTLVWRNRDCFDLKALGINPYGQVYWGRGDVCVEFRDNVKGVERIIDDALRMDMGLETTP